MIDIAEFHSKLLSNLITNVTTKLNQSIDIFITNVGVNHQLADCYVIIDPNTFEELNRSDMPRYKNGDPKPSENYYSVLNDSEKTEFENLISLRHKYIKDSELLRKELKTLGISVKRFFSMQDNLVMLDLYYLYLQCLPEVVRNDNILLDKSGLQIEEFNQAMQEMQPLKQRINLDIDDFIEKNNLFKYESLFSEYIAIDLLSDF